MTNTLPFQPVGSLTTTAVDPLFAAHFGLPVSMQYIYGSLRTKGGTYYWPIRGTYRHRARHLHLSVADREVVDDGDRLSDRVGDFRYAVGTGEGYEGDVTWERRDGSWAVCKDDGEPLMSLGDTTLSWTEGAAVDLRGTIDGPALQFGVGNDEWPFVYTSRLFRVTDGLVEGEPVEGWVFHDTLHLPEGENFMTSPYQRQLQGAWVAFVTEYDDGAIHAGHLVHGLDGFTVLAVHRSDGPPLLSNVADVEVEVDADDFPTRVSYVAGDQTWVWDGYSLSGSGRGRMPVRADIGPDHRWTQGIVRPLGETRKVVSAEALMETYQDRLRPVIR